MNITIQEAKRMIKGHNLVVKDVSGTGNFGYTFAIFRTETVTEPIYYTRAIGEALAVSTTVYEADTVNKKGDNGAYRAMFNRDEVQVIINA